MLEATCPVDAHPLCHAVRFEDVIDRGTDCVAVGRVDHGNVGLELFEDLTLLREGNGIARRAVSYSEVSMENSQ